jgi:transcriptional regulator with XRE-family HTH domain
MAKQGRAPSTLAEKIDHLFTVVHPAQGEYTHEQVATAIEEAGGPTISATYLWQLRKGLRDNPTKRHLEALSSFFGVPPSYFFDEDVAA